jgi:predicted GNAT superfamily acetyltransferase
MADPPERYNCAHLKRIAILGEKKRMPPKLESSADEAAMLALNRAHIAETSALEAAELRSLLAQAFHVGTCARGREAFLIALDQDATYSSPNFQWSSRVTSA